MMRLGERRPLWPDLSKFVVIIGVVVVVVLVVFVAVVVVVVVILFTAVPMSFLGRSRIRFDTKEKKKSRKKYESCVLEIVRS